MENSRVRNTTINSMVALFSKVIVFIVQFICRTILIKTLGTEYLGVNGLFTNILTMLSFAELGIGSAIIFKLYKPIAENDNEKIKTYIKFYQKAYIYIGTIILGLGMLLIPFLKYIVTDVPSIKENIIFIYILFLVNSSISYFFTYKKSIIIGFQKEYITTIINTAAIVLQNIVQIIVLLLTKNFILYLIIQILATLLDNIVASIKANKMYPYIKEKEYTKISKREEHKIFKDVKALVLYKLGYTISTGTDNIIISTFIGVSQVGLLSNYTMIINAVKSFTSSFFNGFTASIGNLNTINDNRKKESIFYQVFLLSFYVYGLISMCLLILINPFIEIWIGQEYVLNQSICIVLMLDLFLDGIRFTSTTFRNTMGLFQRGKFIPLISSIFNIILSLILVNPLGIFGVLLATVISKSLITLWYDPFMIHRLKFKTSFKKFIKTFIYFIIIIIIDFFVCEGLISLIQMHGILGFIIQAIIVVITTILIFLFTTFKMQEFSEVMKRIKHIIGGRRNGAKS